MNSTFYRAGTFAYSDTDGNNRNYFDTAAKNKGTVTTANRADAFIGASASANTSTFMPGLGQDTIMNLLAAGATHDDEQFFNAPSFNYLVAGESHAADLASSCYFLGRVQTQ